jgi:hypothetical protein
MRKKLSFMMSVILLIGIFNINSITITHVYAADDLFNWNKDDTLDTSLSVIQDKAGENEILLECELDQSGTYTLTYYLEDSRRTTVELEHQYDLLEVSYVVEEIETTTASSLVTNITQDLIDESYLEMDYELSVPEWEYISDKTVNSISGALEFDIEYSAASEYPGVAFEIDNKRVVIYWSYQSDLLYYLIDDCEAGTIMPITYASPSDEIQETKILKSLADFNVVATHILDDGTDLEIVEDSSDESPGSRPGLALTFTQPKELDETDWTYKESLSDFNNVKAVVELSDIGSDDYIDFSFDLNNSTNSASKVIEELPYEEGENDSVAYVYDTETYGYTVNLVQDKTSLSNQDTVAQWSELEASKIYNVSVGIQVDLNESGYDSYEFTSYEPENGFAYTYLDYEIKRANLSEAYLDIVPYDVGDSEDIEYTILYSKIITANLDKDDDLWVKHYYDGDTDENIYIPVPFNSQSSQAVYQVIVEFSGVDVESQILNYSAINDANVPPSTPSIEEIDNLYVVPSEDETETDPSKVQFDLVWEAPDNTTTMELDTIFADDNNNPDDDRIYYELLVNDVVGDTDSNPFEVIKVFEVYKEDNTYKIRLMDGTSGNATASSISYYEDGYDETNELFRMEEISIYDNDAWTSTYDITADEDTNTYQVTDTQEAYDFEYPGVNYIRLRAISEIDGEIGISSNSVAVSLTLSLTDYEIPIPSGLAYSTELSNNEEESTEINFDFHSVDIETYEESMLEPIDKEVESIIYRTFLSEDSDAILNIDTTGTSGTAILMASDTSVVIDSDELSLLRDSEVLYYDLGTSPTIDKTLSVNIEGLDENTNYYIRVVAILDIIDLDGTEDETRYGDPSSMLSVTTPTNIEDLDDSEVKPLTVENFQAVATDDNDILSLISWNYPEEILFEEDNFGFEVLSIEDHELDEDYDSSGLSLEEIMESDDFIDGKMELWRIYIEDSVAKLKKYNTESGEFEDQDLDLLTVDSDENYIEFTDDSNSPNTVYYYYARTIKISDGVVLSTSTWQEASFTSSPVNGPINLAVVYDSDYSYDDETEAIIRFDAPIPSDSDLTNDYLMEIWIKGDDDDEYTDTKYTTEFLAETEEGDDGYVRLYYQISDLLSGNSYSVKVRIEDRTQALETLPDGSQTYSVSSFSDRIIVRTEFNQEDYDKEIILEDYLEYYDMKAEELYEDSYFTLSNEETEHIIKYRDSYTIGELAYYKNKEYPLAVNGVTKNVVYLPAEFIEGVNDNNVTLTIGYEDYKIKIRPDAIGSGITDEIDAIESEIDGYDSEAVDYYIKIEVNVGEYDDFIHGRTPARDVVNIQADVVGSLDTETDIDDEMVAALEEIIEDYRTTVSAELSSELTNGIDESNLLEIIEDAIETVQATFESESTEILETYIESNTDSISELEKNMYIMLEPDTEDTDNDVYMIKSGVWQSQDSTYSDGAYYVEEKTLTSFILLSWDSSEGSLRNYYTDDEIEIIYKYELTEIFSTEELSDIDSSIKKYQMVAAFARLLNSGSAKDTVDYLNSKGVDVDEKNMYATVKEEAFLYLYIQTFAIKNNINLESVKIKDYNIIDNIDEINEDYQEIFIQGANMSIIELEDGVIDIDAVVSLEEFIDQLTKIENGLDW